MPRVFGQKIRQPTFPLEFSTNRGVVPNQVAGGRMLLPSKPLFKLGQLLITPGAMAAL